MYERGASAVGEGIRPPAPTDQVPRVFEHVFVAENSTCDPSCAPRRRGAARAARERGIYCLGSRGHSGPRGWGAAGSRTP